MYSSEGRRHKARIPQLKLLHFHLALSLDGNGDRKSD
jgi:hypothetical protein